MIQHEDYLFPFNDVALLYVDGEVEVDGVTVDFGTLAETDAEDFVGNDCEIAGWGETEGKTQTIAATILYCNFFYFLRSKFHIKFVPENVLLLTPCKNVLLIELN